MEMILTGATESWRLPQEYWSAVCLPLQLRSNVGVQECRHIQGPTSSAMAQTLLVIVTIGAKEGPRAAAHSMLLIASTVKNGKISQLELMPRIML